MKPIRGWLPTLERIWISSAVLLAFSLLVYGWIEPHITGIPPMMANFAKQHPTAEKIPLDALLAQRFPIGSSDALLRREFRRVGRQAGCWNEFFKPDTLVPTCLGYAGWSVQGCMGHVNVYWQLDGQGRITTLHGQFTQRCDMPKTGRQINPVRGLDGSA